MKVKLERCEGERQELVARLETGARHYRKLAAEKSAVERSSEQREELLKSRVAQLERQLAGLHIEVTHLKTVFFFMCNASHQMFYTVETYLLHISDEFLPTGPSGGSSRHSGPGL